MSFQQLVTPNPNIPCSPGWCLQYVRQAFGAPVVEPTATAGWNNAKYRHRDYDFPSGCWVPLWFSLATEPAGHVVLRAPDGSIYSTTNPNQYTPRRHPNLADLLAAYAPYNPLTYLGWSEDISGVRVVQETFINPESTTIQEDDLTPEQAAQLAYIVSPQFKADIFAGASDVERSARAAFHREALNTDVPWFGFDGNRPSEGRTTTTLAVNTGYADATAMGLHGAIAALREIVTQLSVKQGVTINYDAIAKAVNDDAAQRMQK